MVAVTVEQYIALYETYLSKEKPIPKEFVPDSNTILLAATQDTRIANYFAQQKFEKDWLFLIGKNIYPLSKDPESFLIAQPHIKPFDLVFGHFLYQEAHGHMNAQNKKTLIHRAKNHYHFDAMKESIQKLAEKISSSTGNLKKTWEKFFSEIDLICEKHGTSGFLVVMNAYLKLGNKAFAREEYDDARTYYFHAMRYAYAADYAKHRSSESIHNAYKGVPPKMTIERVEKALEHHLTPYDFSLAKNERSTLANMYLNYFGEMFNVSSDFVVR